MQRRAFLSLAAAPLLPAIPEPIAFPAPIGDWGQAITVTIYDTKLYEEFKLGQVRFNNEVFRIICE